MLSLATLMLLALTSCGSDEPQDKIWYAQIPFVFHVVDQTEDVVSSCKLGVAYTEMNVDRNTAKMAVSVTLADHVAGSERENHCACEKESCNLLAFHF